jgi:hypothetical protein
MNLSRQIARSGARYANETGVSCRGGGV